jgi:hypothetical protein
MTPDSQDIVGYDNTEMCAVSAEELASDELDEIPLSEDIRYAITNMEDLDYVRTSVLT